MSALSMQQTSVEKKEDFGAGDVGVQKRWQMELRLARKARDKWRKRAQKITKRYREEDTPDDASADYERSARFNVLWSNEQTLGPAIYAKAPKAIVSRRYRDRDIIGRTACVILERALDFSVETSDFHKIVKRCRKDYLLVAQGTAWVRYEAELGEYTPRNPEPEEPEEAEEPGETEDQSEPEEPAQEVRSERVCVDYVHWDDYLCSVARTDGEIKWRARRVYYTRDELIKLFGEEKGKSCPLDYEPKNVPDEGEAIKAEQETFKKAAVWEIWSLDDKKTYFINEKAETPLAVKDDKLRLQGFWPVPETLLGTTTNDTVVPIPDYVLYQDQARELDDITARISLIAKALKVAGVYDASQPALAQLLDEGIENRLIPVDQWAAFAEKGGLKGTIDFLPMAEIIEVLLRLYEARQQVKNDLYEITGISDIVRGQATSGMPKTATEQSIKGKFANLRLSDRQDDMASFARSILRIMAELISEHFSPETLWEISDFEQYAQDQIFPQLEQQRMAQGQPVAGGMVAQPPALQPSMGVPGQPVEPQQPIPGAAQPEPIDPMMQARVIFVQAVQLLRNDKLRSFRIDIETDSTVEIDLESEKQARVEFLTAASQFMQNAAVIVQSEPQMMPLLGKMLLFGVRGFRAGRDLESAFEETIDKLEKAAAQPQQPSPPSPEQIKAEAMQKQAELDLQKGQQDAQSRQAEIAAKAQERERDALFKAQQMERDQQAAQAEAERQAQMKAIELAMKQREHEMHMAQMERQEQIEALKHARELEMMEREQQAHMQKSALDADMQQQKHEAGLEALDRKAEHEERRMEQQEKAQAETAGDD